MARQNREIANRLYRRHFPLRALPSSTSQSDLACCRSSSPNNNNHNRYRLNVVSVRLLPRQIKKGSLSAFPNRRTAPVHNSKTNSSLRVLFAGPTYKTAPGSVRRPSRYRRPKGVPSFTTALCHFTVMRWYPGNGCVVDRTKKPLTSWSAKERVEISEYVGLMRASVVEPNRQECWSYFWSYFHASSFNYQTNRKLEQGEGDTGRTCRLGHRCSPVVFVGLPQDGEPREER